MTLTDRGGTPALVVNAKSVEERTVQGQMMTPKEKLKVHADIETQNRAKLEAWKQDNRKAGAAK